MGRFATDIVSYLKKDDLRGFLAAFEGAGFRWSGPELAQSAAAFGLTLRRAQQLVAERMAGRVRGARSKAEMELRLADYAALADELGHRIALDPALVADRAEEILRRGYIEMFAAGVDMTKLLALADSLRIDIDRAGEICRSEALARIEAYCGEILADGCLDPGEDRGLTALQAQLGVPAVEFDASSRAALDAARRRWQLETDPLPECDAPIVLARGEHCHWTMKAEASESRSRTIGLGYAGPALSVPIGGGLRFKAGALAVRRAHQDYEHSFGAGLLVLTDRRLVWLAPTRTITLRFSAIAMIETFSDALIVRRGTGKSLTLRYDRNAAAGIIAARLIERGGAALT